MIHPGVSAILLVLLLNLVTLPVARGQAPYTPSPTHWETIAPELAGMDPVRLEAAMTYAGDHGSTGVVILRGGRIVAERYWAGHGPRTTRPIFSCTKSVTSILIGMLMDRGLIRGLGQSASDILREWARDARRLITIGHFLTMTTGLQAHVASTAGGPKNTARTLARPLENIPGRAWYYNTETTDLLLLIAERAARLDAGVLMRRLLFEPLGMTDSSLPTSNVSGGRRYNSINSTPRDLARFGLLVLRGGRWIVGSSPVQLVREAWVKQAGTRSQSANGAYGLLFWLNDSATYRLPLQPAWMRPIEGPFFEGAPRDMVSALGFSDSRCLVIPSQDLVITRLGPAWTDPEGSEDIVTGTALAGAKPQDIEWMRLIQASLRF